MNLKNNESETLNAEIQNDSKNQIPNPAHETTHSFLLDAPAPWPEKLLRLGILFLALLCLAATHAKACGPDFPNNLLDSGDYAVLLAPTVRFGDELERMQLGQTRWRARIAEDNHVQEAADAELTDLRTALKRQKTSSEEINRICEAHQVQRERLQNYSAAYDTWQHSGGWIGNRGNRTPDCPPEGKPPERPLLIAVPGLPDEFADYFAGACEWRDPATTNRSKARAAWERLLARPAAERKFKSTWAAYMLGRSWEEEDSTKATNYFQQVRELAGKGFADSIGLATASLGREARLHLRAGRFQTAIALYLEQLAAGDASAIESLRETAAQALGSADALPELARDECAQKVLTAYLISANRDGFPHEVEDYFTRWLDAVEAADVKDVESAEKFALVAYRSGAFDLAKRWIVRARGTPLSQWLQAKLLLREGKVEQAAALLAKVSHSFPLADRGTNAPASLADNLSVQFANEYREPRGVGAQVLGELGVLQLNRQQYTESLDALLRSGFWGDAAYVAERVLKLDELKAYVQTHWPARMTVTNTEPETATQPGALDQTGEAIRHLLARRLTRELRGAEAREFYPAEWRSKFDDLAAKLIEGWNESLSAAQRARALFTAAAMARTNGMELLGTETGPDWFLHGGDFEFGVTPEARTNESFTLLAAKPDELRRASAHRPDPDARFHYRYQAAFLAWEAAKLMPDNSEETAFMLWQGGEWLKNRDPITADGFYKTLVRRCRRTELGVEADRIRWFPRLDENRRVIPRHTSLQESGTENSPEAPPREAEATSEAEGSEPATELAPAQASARLGTGVGGGLSCTAAG